MTGNYEVWDGVGWHWDRFGTWMVQVQVLFRCRCCTGAGVVQVKVFYRCRCCTGSCVVQVQVQVYRWCTCTGVVSVSCICEIFSGVCQMSGTGKGVAQVQVHVYWCCILYSYRSGVQVLYMCRCTGSGPKQVFYMIWRSSVIGRSTYLCVCTWYKYICSCIHLVHL